MIRNVALMWLLVTGLSVALSAKQTWMDKFALNEKAHVWNDCFAPVFIFFFFPLLLTRSTTLFSSSPLCRESTLEENSRRYVPFSSLCHFLLLFHWVISCCQLLFIDRKFTKKKMKSFCCHLEAILSSSLQE